jgi:hypothetical protein
VLPQERVQGKPGARSTHGPCAKGSKHTVVTTVAPEITRLSPRNGFNGFLRALPGDRLVVTVIRVMRSIIANLTPAPGRQDHTTSPSASASLVSRAFASTASHPDVRDDGQRPLVRDETPEISR